MRLTVLCLVVGICNVFAGNSYSQNTKLSLSMSNVTLEKVLDEIEKQSEFYFLFNQKLIDTERVVNVEAEDKKISDVLDGLFKRTDVNYLVLDRQIVLTTTKVKELDRYVGANTTNRSFLPRKKIRTLRINEIADRTITGRVIDSDGEPIPGVNVIAKETTVGTITDAEGKYTLDISNEVTTLVFSYVGMNSEEIEIGNRTVIDVTMIQDISSLEEIVVIGYGAVKRSDLTGSVASITSEDIQEIPTNTVSALLQGRAAGVQVTTGDAAPGGGINIRIRGTSTITGSTEPLYIIDGFPVNSDNDDLYVSGGFNEGTVESTNANKVRPNALSFINPNDIESIEILKDAAATAIYGSRGANGVVLIKTKRGVAGKTKVSVNYSYGSQSIIRKITRLDGPAFAARRNEAEINSGVDPANVGFNGSDPFHPLPQNAETHNWQDLLYRTAPVHDMSVSFSGGDNNTKYLLSGKFYDQEGIMINSGFKDAQLRLNLDQNLGELVSVRTNVLLSHSINDRVPTGAGFNYNTVTFALGYSPAINPDWFDETTGLWYTDTKLANQYTNPFRIVGAIDDQLKTNRVLANTFVDLKFNESLKLTASYGIDYSDGTRETFIDRTLTIFGSPVARGDADINTIESLRTNANAYLTWTKSFGQHNINAVAGTELIEQTISNLNIGVRDFATDDLGTENLAAGDAETRSITNGKNKWQTAGFFGRVNYDYQNRYYASVNLRRDGSSRFGAANKWSFFPSLALAWRPSEEAFMQGQSLITDLKIRASVGQTGNGALDPYSSIGLWSINRNYSFDNQVVNAASLSRISNPDLKWETTTQWNVGFDARFLNNRLGFTFDYFIKDTDDLILPVVIPKSTGFQSSIQNIGSLRNSGLEFSVDYVVLDGDFHWDINANLTYLKSEATDVGEGTTIDPNTGEPYVEVATWPRNGGPRLYNGRPAGEIYGFIIEGVFRDQAQADSWPVDMDPSRANNQEGFWIYKDVNGDGIITNDDKESLGTGQPDFIFGFTNRFSWKNFDLSLFFQGITGADVFMFYGGDIDAEFTDVWTPDNRDATSAINRSGGNGWRGEGFHNRGMEDASYLRLKNVRLGYSVPTSTINFLGGLNVYLNATNVFTITSYDGYNPDVSSGGTFAFSEGFDTGVYPLAKTYTIGVNINF
ncbi:TonB-dependent receptor [Fulvivirgaceae bacterium BMA12]|uniref:TonB-dependent receptor n=1 Tax=Agaribacillus aureus TaxID=3051825 RepID=A0ABT8L9G3_9BACT|nr:TonB-dependent receptor [Fulvivirgaceae bacterium BMA12]